jgi:hypothetical protein
VQSALGVDSRRIVALMKEFPFTLQVEDPVQFWADPADRYLRFAASYRKLISDPRRLMFDVNAVKERDRSHVFLPSAEAVGTELARTVSSAASASGRAAIYSEFTVGTQDWSLIRTALGHASVADSRRNGWLTSSGSSLLLTPADNAQYYLDGRVWPAVSTDGALVPAGRHVLSTSRSWRNLFDSGAENPRLISCTGDLLAAQSDATSLTLRYSSPGRAVVLISQRPHEILVDGEAEDLPFEPSSRDWSVVLPAGEHQVQVTTNTTAGVAVNVWGWASSSLIALGGALATLTMLGIYLQIRMRRLARRRG